MITLRCLAGSVGLITIFVWPLLKESTDPLSQSPLRVELHKVRITKIDNDDVTNQVLVDLSPAHLVPCYSG